MAEEFRMADYETVVAIGVWSEEKKTSPPGWVKDQITMHEWLMSEGRVEEAKKYGPEACS